MVELCAKLLEEFRKTVTESAYLERLGRLETNGGFFQFDAVSADQGRLAETFKKLREIREKEKAPERG